MAAENKDAGAAALHITPLPETARGFGKILNSNKNGQIVYGNGKSVVVRSLDNPAVGYQFNEHKATVNVAAFSPNCEWVASGDAEGNVLVWSTLNFNVKTTVKICSTVLDVAWDADGKRIAACGDGKQDRVKVFMWDSGSNLGDMKGHEKSVLSVAYRKVRPYRIVTASEDLSVCFWQGPPFKFDHSFREHERYPNLVRFNPDGSQYASVGADSKIFIFDGSTGEKVKEVKNAADGHKGAIYSFSWSPDGKQILTCGADKTAKVWNVADDSIATTFTFGNGVDDMQVGALWHGQHIVTISLSGSLNYLDIANPANPKLVVQGSQAPIQDLAVDGPRGKLYTVDMAGRLTQLDVGTGNGVWFQGKGHGGKTVVAVAVAADGSTVTTVGLDDNVLVNDVASLQFGEGVAIGGKPNALDCGRRDPALAAIVTQQQQLVITRRGNPVSTQELPYVPLCVAFNGDDSKLAIGGKDKNVYVYDLAGDEAKQVAVYQGHARQVTGVAWSGDGKYLSSCGGDKAIYHWDAKGASPFFNKTGWTFHSSTVNDIAWSPNSDRFVSGGQDEQYILWKDFKEWGHDRDAVGQAHKGGVMRTRFVNNNTLVTLGADRGVKVWNLA